MSNVPFISRHKAFQAGTPGGGSDEALPCVSYDIPDFIRYGQTSATVTCEGSTQPTGFEATITNQIGITRWLPTISGIPSSGLDAQLHGADANLTLSNRGARARYDYYFWQGRDIWKYDSRIETSGSFDTFASWTIDATPVVATLEGTTLGMYPMLLGSGNLEDQAPYLCTAALDGSNVIRIKKNLITGIWDSGIIGTLSFPGNRIPVAEVFHNNAVYFITDQDDRAVVVNFDHDSVSELAWPEEVRHPMDLNVFRSRVYCLNKTVSNSGVGIFSIDPVLGISKALQVETDLGTAMTSNNFHGRNMLFTCTAQNVITGSKPHMMAFQYTNAFIQASGGEVPGTRVWAIAETGTAGDLAVINDQTGKNPNLLADEWAAGGAGSFFRPSITIGTARKTEEVVYRPWVNDLIAVPSGGDERIVILFRENAQDGAVFRQYRYRNTPNEDRMDLEGPAYQSGQPVTGNHHFSYCTARFGGGHYDAQWGVPNVTISGVEDLNNGKTRVWFIVDGDFLYPDAHPIRVNLLYGGQGRDLSTPHKNIATIDGSISGTISNNQLFIGLADGIPQYVDWNTQADNLIHKARTNIVVLAQMTGTIPEVRNVKKMSQIAFVNVNAEPIIFPTGPNAYGRFQNPSPAFETFATGPLASQRLTNVVDFTFSTGPSTPVASGLWTLITPPATGIVGGPVIWWGFRSSHNRISGFGRAQGI
jgi:hypothetical protein